MTLNIRCSRGATAIGIASLLLAVSALMPGGFGHAVAQTGGPPPDDTTTAPPPGGGSTTGAGTSPGGTTTGPGTTTTTPGGDSQTTTPTSEGTTTTTTSSGATSNTAPDGTTTTVVSNPNVENTVTVAQGGTTIDVNIPSGAIPVNVSLVIDPIPPIQVPQSMPTNGLIDGMASSLSISPDSIVVLDIDVGGAVERLENFAAAPGIIVGIKAFEFDLKAPNGTEIQPGKPITLDWLVPPAVFAAAGGKIDNILLLYFNPAAKKWEASRAVSLAGNEAKFVVKHFSTYAFAIRVASAVTTPAPPTAATPGTVPPPGVSPAAPAATAGTSASAGAGAAVPPGQVVPRPANTGTGIPALDQAGVLPIALVALGLGILGGIGLRTARRRS